ncbi:MAG TPA: Asp-tRNA(Asn)/Glu-tRNA(Gln) amidotransferase subunit GatC [Microbacteriaceae bacterium]|nr:Asp-tRNA(Asn)/Glu-tRNA(Gln) amidotransferase subunit GatC [Microbacteriaceae bacterium]
MSGNSAPYSGAETAKLTTDDVRRIAHTAQIEITDEEASSLQRDLSAILVGVESLTEFAQLDVEASVRPFALTNVTRADKPMDVLTRAEALQNAPEVEDGMFKVSSILGGEH